MISALKSVALALVVAQASATCFELCKVFDFLGDKNKGVWSSGHYYNVSRTAITFGMSVTNTTSKCHSTRGPRVLNAEKPNGASDLGWPNEKCVDNPGPGVGASGEPDGSRGQLSR